MTAAAQVLDIDELFESILLFLTPRDMLKCQRIDRRWKATIKGSKFQNALFLRTKPPNRASLHQDYRGIYNWQANAFGEFTFSIPDTNLTGLDIDTALVPNTHQAHINPLLCHVFPHRDGSPTTPPGHVYNFNDHLSVPAIWKNMLLTQPAVGSAWLKIHIVADHSKKSTYYSRPHKCSSDCWISVGAHLGSWPPHNLTLADLVSVLQHISSQRRPRKSLYFEVESTKG